MKSKNGKIKFNKKISNKKTNKHIQYMIFNNLKRKDLLVIIFILVELM